jgi:hypothetical protein
MIEKGPSLSVALSIAYRLPVAIGRMRIALGRGPIPPYNPDHPCAIIFIAHERRTKERFFAERRGCSMRQDKPLHAVKRVGTRNKNDSAKRKTVRRQKVFKTSSWYERAALSIKAAPSRA